jgi:hypothetical protein
VLVCQVDITRLTYRLQAVEDVHAVTTTVDRSDPRGTSEFLGGSPEAPISVTPEPLGMRGNDLRAG